MTRARCAPYVRYLRGSKVERIYRETKVLTIGGGSLEVMKDLAARQMGY